MSGSEQVQKGRGWHVEHKFTVQIVYNVRQHNYKTITFCSVDHRHSSLHIHHPLSKLPPEGKKKKSGKKKREAGRRRASGSGEANGAPTIEEEEEEDGKEDTTTATPDTDSDMHNEDDQVG